MTAEGGERQVGVFGGQDQGAALGILLEGENAVGQYRRLGHALAEAFRHSAEILADDEALVAVALKREDADQLLHRITDIGAGSGRLSGRNPVEVLQCYHVVDA